MALNVGPSGGGSFLLQQRVSGFGCLHAGKADQGVKNQKLHFDGFCWNFFPFIFSGEKLGE